MGHDLRGCLCDVRRGHYREGRSVETTHRTLAGKHGSTPGGKLVHEVKSDFIHRHPQHLRPNREKGGGGKKNKTKKDSKRVEIESERSLKRATNEFKTSQNESNNVVQAKQVRPGL